jgi:heme exporter protein A
VLDEPFASLDAAGIEAVRTVIEAHIASGGMALLTSHQDVPIKAASNQRIELAA